MTIKYPSDGLSTALEVDCCNTACLIQPRFFYGQLLTDADLNQLLNWAKTKFRLHRASNGWGVVCGLQLSLDPAHPTHVIIHPGQAIDCCGYDLVVCEPISVDLSEACPKEECLEPSYNRWGKTTRRPSPKSSDEVAYEHPETEPLSPLMSLEGSQVLDLFLHYATEGNDSQVRLSPNNSAQSSACEYSRLKETASLKWQLASDPEEIDSQRVGEFVKAYEEMRLVNIEQMRIARKKLENKKSLRLWLMERLDAQPLQEFGFVRDWIIGMESSDIANNAAQILFFMGMDALLARLRCSCPRCSSKTGIRVGRVWLQGQDAAGSENCRIIFVSNQPPYRRELHSEPCYPALHGCTNLAPYLWQDWNTVYQSLRSQGVNIAENPNDAKFENLKLDSWEQLYSQAYSIINCDEFGNALPVRATVVHLGEPFGSRVVGFSVAETTKKAAGKK